jgi:cytochrome c5
MQMLRIRERICFLFASLALAATPAAAQDAGPGGKDVYDVVCARCHAKGADAAPRVGDRAAWSKRAAQGIGSLTRNALEGIRRMPAHGEDADLTDLEIQRATVYMVNQSGGNWLEPRPPGVTGELSGAQVVRAQCAQCHQAGYNDAPRMGDHGNWQRYLRLGMDAAVRKVAKGHADMPPRGGRPSLTDAEIRNAIIFMASTSRAPRR